MSVYKITNSIYSLSVSYHELYNNIINNKRFFLIIYGYLTNHLNTKTYLIDNT